MQIDFDAFSDAQLIDVRLYANILGVKPVTVWRGIHAGTMAPPIKVGQRCTRFNVGEIRKKHGLPRGSA